MRLAVNIDHIATVREARKARDPEPLAAALIAEGAGAEGITVHLRTDRRHIQDRDLEALRHGIGTKLNIEMAVTDEMAGIALKVRPDQVTLVPERPRELTTEGGLDVLQNAEALRGKGIDTVAVTAVNDVFVMNEWQKATGAQGRVDFLADGNGDFAKAIDMTFDGSGNGLGTRSKRYSMLIDDGVVKHLNIEEAPGKVDLSSAENLLKAL